MPTAEQGRQGDILLTYLFRFLKIIWQFHIYIYTLKLYGPLFSLVPLLF